MFNWRIYRELNQDLINAHLNTEKQIMTHWKTYGHKENRKTKITDVFPDFDLELYKNNNPELKFNRQEEYELDYIRKQKNNSFDSQSNELDCSIKQQNALSDPNIYNEASKALINTNFNTAIIYAYYETSSAIYNLEFYIKTALTNDSNYLYIFVINGEKCSIDIPVQSNIVILKRNNIGFDFGAHAHAIRYLLNKCTTTNKIEDLSIKYFIFMNCGVIGPFLPVYYPKNLHWSNIFIDRLNDQIKLVGTTIVCLPAHDKGGYGPKIEGFCFCSDKIGLSLLVKNGTVFTDHASKIDAIINGEFQLTKVILDNGYNIDCLLYKYQNIDWRDSNNYNLNNYKYPSRSGSYDDISIHPFEVVFHKWYWNYDSTNTVLFNYVDKYKKWKLNSLH